MTRAALAEAGRAGLVRLRRLARGPSRLRVPGQLLFAPQDLRVADPAVADDMAAGLFVFGDMALDLGRGSPFAAPSPGVGWTRDLYAFGWLRHLRAAGTPEAAAIARALVAQVAAPRRGDLDPDALALPAVTARRITSFLAHSPLLMTGADHGFYRGYLRTVGRDSAALDRDMRDAPVPTDRLAAAIGLCFAGLSCAGLEGRFRRANAVLAAELEAQILPDGGHVGRNPATLLELLLDLLPLRLLYGSREIQHPPAIDVAIDGMMAMLRHLRHGCGDLALFNGMGRTPISDLATVLSHDTVRARSAGRAGPSGYDRLEAGATLVLADVGAAPPLSASGEAHAGCLSFELSCGRNLIVVNCGAPAQLGPDREAARLTAAHSTLVLGGESSATLLGAAGEVGRAEAGWAERSLVGRLGPVLVQGPRNVGSERGVAGDGGALLDAGHDGYSAAFGATHRRRLRLAPDGSELVGEDSLTFEAGAGSGEDVQLPFHIHPAARARLDGETGQVLIAFPDGETWRFACEEIVPRLEPGLFFAVSEGRRPTVRIVVEAHLGPASRPRLRWRFAREVAGAVSDGGGTPSA